MTKINLKTSQDKVDYSSQCTMQDKTKEQQSLEPVHIVPSWNPIDRNEKPPYSYATIIAHAILSSKERKLSLSEIYLWITSEYPFYCTTGLGWQNSVRHNLSLHKSFVKIQRDASNPNHPRKGCYWTIKPGKEQGFIENLELPVTKRAGRRRSSQTSVYSSTPYSVESSSTPPSDPTYCKSSSGTGSCNNSIYSKSSSSPSLGDQDYYFPTSSLSSQNMLPYYNSAFVNNMFIEPYSTSSMYSTNAIYSTSPLYPSLYDHNSLFN
ncbi:hypothetical protein BY458DRAFT_27029 [Sporodiniella umbellata]|nr:hypothetical protein BY458DRAFT_27029 [Sporodiniella umbellata]